MKKSNFFLVLITAVVICSFSQSIKAQASDKKISKSTGYAQVNGLKIYYEIHGQGKPLVLLHRAYMTIDLTYGELIPALSKNNQVIAIEFQGHGRTFDSKREISYDAFADGCGRSAKSFEN